MKISIIIVNFNGSEHLPEIFKSLHSLDYPGEKLEILFFDNGSNDDSLQIVRRECPEAIVISNAKNMGFAAPHRIAAEKATGKVLAFVNNDMRVHPQWVREGIACLDRDAGIVCVASKILSWDGQEIDFSGGSLQYLGYAQQYHNNEVNDRDPILFPCGGAMFICRDIFLEAGAFDDDYFAIFEDVDLGWRLWLLGYKVVMAQRSITYHKGHATLDSKGQTQKRYLMHRNALVTIIKNYEQENLQKILPTAMNLALKRALLFMGVDKKNFYFWEKKTARIQLNNNSIEGMLHLVVLDDIFDDYENIARKRKLVQDKRKRSDKQLFELFGDPFRNIMGFREYFWQELSLLGGFHLHELFQCTEAYEHALNHGVELAREELYGMRRERDNMLLQGCSQILQNSSIRILWRKFWQTKGECGLAGALNKSVRFCFERVWKRE